MCGRFAITLPPEAVRAFFAYVEQPNFPPRYNIAPTQPIPIVVARAHTGGLERHFLLARWGFLPGFVKDPKEFPLLINARAETLAEKPSFRAALRRRRCLVIADGFYEWRRAAPAGEGAGQAPYLIRRVDRAPIGFAGLMETWSDPSGGEIDTACIITVAANRLMALIHDRMPAICLNPKRSRSGSTTTASTRATATALLRPAPEAALELVADRPVPSTAPPTTTPRCRRRSARRFGLHRGKRRAKKRHGRKTETHPPDRRPRSRRRASPLPLAGRTIRSTSPITTRNGACPNGTTARCSKSSCSTASRPGSRGSPSCASARRSAPPSTASSPKKSCATTPRRSRR